MVADVEEPDVVVVLVGDVDELEVVVVLAGNADWVATPKLPCALVFAVAVDGPAAALAGEIAGCKPPQAAVSISKKIKRATTTIPRSSATRTNAPFSHTRGAGPARQPEQNGVER